MLDSDCEPITLVFTSLLKNFFKDGRKEDRHKMSKEMVRRGCSSDLMLLNTNMDYIQSRRDGQRAGFHSRKLRILSPDARNYSIVSLVKAAHVDENVVLDEEGSELCSGHPCLQ